MIDDPRYEYVNSRDYPPITRASAYNYAKQLLGSKLGSPSACAVRTYAVSDANGGHTEDRLPERLELMRVFRRYIPRPGVARVCWASRKPTKNHHKGWGRLIHDVSHMLLEYRHPAFRPHDPVHHVIEREVLDYVLDAGWLYKKPTPVKRGPTPGEKLDALNARLARWLTKRKRAETAITKLVRQN